MENKDAIHYHPRDSLIEDRMRYKIPCLILAITLGASGCATTPSPATRDSGGVELTLTSSGNILTGGKETDLDHLSRQLHRIGATLDTPITINIPTDTPLTSVSAITGRLASAGYRKILFKRPKHAAISTQIDRQVEIPARP